MLRFSRSTAFTGAGAIALLLGASASEAAKSCKRAETYVSGFGCTKNTEIAKARKTCAGLKPPAAFDQCLCKDAQTIGACGD